MTPESKRLHLLLDTDIGTDVDDAMTLIQLIGAGLAPQMSITTAYGDTDLRAKIAKRYCDLAGVQIPIYKGEQETLSGKEIWVSGLEGSLHSGLAFETYASGAAIDHILDSSLDSSRDLCILAIAPLTNIAKAVLKDPSLPKRVSHLYLMGGRFEEGQAEHNILSDVTAADIVFSAGFNITAVGIEATKRVQMPAQLIERIAAAGAAGLALSKDIYQWWEFWAETWNVPHDPIAALTFLKPEMFTLSESGDISIVTAGDELGKSVFRPEMTGTHRIVKEFDEQEVAEEIVKAIELSEHRRVNTNAIA